MEITHLPPALTGYLNELAFFRQPSDEMLFEFEQGLSDLRAWHYFESAYWVSDAQKQELANLEFLLNEMAALPPLDKLLPQAFEVVQLMESVQAERDKATYSADPLINDLVLAGACWSAGQALERAVPERLPRLQVWGSRLQEAFEAMRPVLPADAQRDLEVGFRHLSLAMEELGSLASVKAGMARLVETSELLLVLVEWRRKGRERQMERFRRWPIPLVGAALEECFEALSEVPDRVVFWGEAVRPLLVELSHWWGQQRELLPLPADFLAEWIPQVDQDLAELTEFSAEEGISDEVLADLTDWVDALAAGFAEAQRRMQATGHLRGGAAGHYYEVIQGLLRNTLPVPAVPGLFTAANPPEAWQGVVDRMLEFTKGGPRELLYEARDELLRLVPPPDVSEGGGWTCPFCQQKVPSGRTTCGHCGGGASVSLEVQSWNA